jgi:hypothetical protein
MNLGPFAGPSGASAPNGFQSPPSSDGSRNGSPSPCAARAGFSGLRRAIAARERDGLVRRMVNREGCADDTRSSRAVDSDVRSGGTDWRLRSGWPVPSGCTGHGVPECLRSQPCPIAQFAERMTDNRALDAGPRASPGSPRKTSSPATLVMIERGVPSIQRAGRTHLAGSDHRVSSRARTGLIRSQTSCDVGL